MPVPLTHSSRCSITKTSPCNEDPLTPHFYIVKLGFTGVYIFLAHLSRRLIGELIAETHAPATVVRRHLSTISNIFFSETACPIKAKFYVEPPWVGGTKVCLRHLGHMTKMAATPIYGKNPSKIFFSETSTPISNKLGTCM